MKIGIQTWGSNGDIRPMIALANGLQQAGHKVTLVVSSLDNRNYHAVCERLNIDYLQTPERFNFDLEAFAQLTFRMNSAQWLVALLETAFFPYEAEIYQAAKHLVSDNDLVIGHHFLYPLKLAALKQDKTFYSVTFCHGIIPTRSQAPIRFPDLGPLLNPWQWRILDFAFNLMLKEKLTRLWRAEGMPDIKSVLSDLLSSDRLDLVAVDPALCPGYLDWPPHHHACGFLNLPADADDWRIDDKLRLFLDSGPAPVYMTFGSLQQAVPDWSMQLFIDACRLVGCRAIIQTSAERYPENSELDNIYFIGKHPHQRLFPHCAAVVHHGGAGTTHSASLCGRPSIVIPFMDEQLFWGQTLEKLGIAPKSLSAKRATAAGLASRIDVVLSNQAFSERASSIGATISGSQGVMKAVQLIEHAAADIVPKCG
ncbi:glycosyltransferase [Methylomarinum sp. Ch1-1]|uniref:Glycosyltransferase n=1 Tax=Methylomarinum roseum TaxID=3067653 RepID=A0AAU7NVD8_9GAMM|nr:glycosyltransferase [Methylomarinum sp. Ch1-1]MDP4523067.1 glycosyltransferase [Methylomarinum sp. Ch1-1]